MKLPYQSSSIHRTNRGVAWSRITFRPSATCECGETLLRQIYHARSRARVGSLVARIPGAEKFKCEGLFCECTKGSQGCNVIASNCCMDELLCLGDKCTCINGCGD